MSEKSSSGVVAKRNLASSLKTEHNQWPGILPIAISNAQSLCPPNVPDEALISDVSRYHILSANSTTRQTFHELFGSAPFPLSSWIPPHIGTLASHIPGDVQANALEILQYKTLFPLFQLFSALSIPETVQKQRTRHIGSDVPQRPQREFRDPINIPRRSGAHQGIGICLACLHEDHQTYGIPYIHLSHQIPGVEVCAKHGGHLIYNCPFCGCHFEMPRDLILVLWQQCRCKRYLLDSDVVPTKSENMVTLSYAKFAAELLSSRPTHVPPKVLIACYKERAHELNYVWGCESINRNRLFTDIEEFYGSEFLARADSAYREKRITGWFNLFHERYVSEVPLARHLLFSHFLFRSADKFWMKLLQPITESLTSQHNDSSPKKKTALQRVKKKSDKSQEKAVRIQNLKRQLLRLARQEGICKIEQLWRCSFREINQLIRLEPNAAIYLKEQLKEIQPKPKKIKTKLVGLHPDDEVRAKKILAFAENFYASIDKPVLMSINRLCKEIKCRLASKERFPATTQAIQEVLESNWHFYARRIIWAMLYLRKGSKYAIKDASGIEHHRFLVLLEYFKDVDTSVPLSKGAVMNSLKRYGIERDWKGPCPEREFFAAGRSYYESH